MREASLDSLNSRWEGLLHPIKIAVGDDGRVYVADDGDKTVKVFDASGRSLQTLGRKGSGPGEFEGIQDVVVVNGDVYVLDPKLGRVQRFPANNDEASVIPGISGDFMSALGSDHLVFANDASWSVPGSPGSETAPAVLVTGMDGEALRRLGKRKETKNPFVDRVANFVLPAGTADGNWIWLAYLNHPTVRLLKSDGSTSSEVRRSIPFDWQQLPADFQPSAAMMVPRDERPPIPFDPLSLGIATDTAGRAYILTALGPPDRAGVPTILGVDRLTPLDSLVSRFHVPAPATHIAVSPGGNWIYLLDASTAAMRVYEWLD